MAAPAAFLAGVTVAVLLVRNTLDAGRPAATTRAAPAATATGAAATRPGRPATARGRTEAYTIREGDTIGSIAAAHDTTVDALLALNPTVDPVSLQIGQRIRVPRGGR